MPHPMHRSPHIAVMVLVTIAATFFASGCEENCTSAERSYRRALASERTELVDREQLSGDSPAQFGLALKTELIGEIADFVIQPVIDAALTVGSSVRVDGKRVEINSEGQLVDIDVESDSACDHCFRVRAGLGGAIVADIPQWGRERAELGGSLAIVAPLLLEGGESSDAALKLDLPAFVDVGRSSLSARLGGVSDEVSDLLEGPVSDFFFEMLQRRLDPVTLVEFDAPSFGIPGFEILPVELVTDGSTGSVFAGFATNVEALNAPGAAGVAPITDLGADENMALAFQPAIISHSLSLLMNDGQVSRTYNLSGSADEQGNSHVTLDGFRVGHDVLDDPADDGLGRDAGSEADAWALTSGEFPTRTAGLDGEPDLPFALGFEVFNLAGGEGLCFGFGAEAVGGVSVRDSALTVDLLDVRFTDAFLQRNLVELNNWVGADFVQQSRTLVSQSLDEATVTVPGTELSVGAMGLELRENAVVFRANSSTAPAD